MNCGQRIVQTEEDEPFPGMYFRDLARNKTGSLE